MVILVALLRDAGIWGVPALAAGGLGSLVTAVAVLALTRRARAALRLGVAAAALGALSALAGGVGALARRVAVEDGLAHVRRPVERQRMRREGYLAARGPARIGLLGAAVPLIVGVAVTFVAARRRAREEASREDLDVPFAPRVRLGVPGRVAIAGVLASGLAVAVVAEPAPAGSSQASATARRAQDDLEDIHRTEGGELLLDACDRVEGEMRRDSFDPGLFPSLPEAARRCVEARVQEAAMLPSLDRVKSRLGSVALSDLAARYPELQRMVEDTAGEVEQIARSVERDPPPVRVASVTIGDPDVSGPLRERDVRAALERIEDPIRRCYEQALERDPDLVDALTVRIVVGPGGGVTSVSNNEPEALEPGTVACVQRAFSGRRYPAPRGGAAVVAVPILLAPISLDQVR